MRTLFLLLLLANGAVAGYWVLRPSDGGESNLLHQQINPEKIRIVAFEEKAENAPRSGSGRGTTCVEWSGFPSAEAERAASALAAAGLQGKATQRSVEQNAGYWVYLPPPADPAQVDQRIALLRKHGITEYFLVQEPGRFRNAISLGVFRSEELANRFLADVRSKGITTAVIEQRPQRTTLVAFLIKDPDSEQAARLAGLQTQFPGSELKAVACE
ncbi:MAG: hypothetical protein DI596_12190 [Azospira oryzae]|uniref:SPOR domain-containing protein n=1 Tax=Pelomicrobium methylotrophicum TaxID=2602750 RepID=A0A5C7ELH2_9PROT|nr:SPOR domain-containing protein [Pelomicrobium methylotrophicum]PZP54885.1 MAG: hypothetical protein DI596_12190 [Azospira oryzae]PZP77575.1 MAG: hypothetical protein DI593_12190 [Azospira oryzae]TXF13190.1 SPOR domain-containing protein [Pelomicrobium methylotrophicum]